jgi:hypothetical protein
MGPRLWGVPRGTKSSRYDPSVNLTTNSLAVRRAFRAASSVASLGVVASAVLLAGPASAAVPEGWSDPKDVDALHALGLLAGIPVLLFLLITLAVYVPSLARGSAAVASGPDHEWFGGPRKAMDELAGPDGEDSKAGGASGRW